MWKVTIFAPKQNAGESVKIALWKVQITSLVPPVVTMNVHWYAGVTADNSCDVQQWVVVMHSCVCGTYVEHCGTHDLVSSPSCDGSA